MPEPNVKPTSPPLALALPPFAPSYARRSQLGWDLSEGTSKSTLVRIVESHRAAARPALTPRGDYEPSGAGSGMTLAATAIDKTDWLVGELRRLARMRALQYTLEVGRLIVTHVFDGSLEKLRNRGRNEPYYRSLAQRGDLPFSAITLWRCVKIFELVERFPAVLSMDHLALAHLRAVAALPPPTQQALLAQAQKHAWTSEELVRVARRTRVSASGGAPSPKVLARRVRRLKQLASELGAELEAAPELQARLSASARAALGSVHDELTLLEASLAEPDREVVTVDGFSSGVHRVSARVSERRGEDE